MMASPGDGSLRRRWVHPLAIGLVMVVTTPGGTAIASAIVHRSEAVTDQPDPSDESIPEPSPAPDPAPDPVPTPDPMPTPDPGVPPPAPPPGAEPPEPPTGPGPSNPEPAVPTPTAPTTVPGGGQLPVAGSDPTTPIKRDPGAPSPSAPPGGVTPSPSDPERPLPESRSPAPERPEPSTAVAGRSPGRMPAGGSDQMGLALGGGVVLGAGALVGIVAIGRRAGRRRAGGRRSGSTRSPRPEVEPRSGPLGGGERLIRLDLALRSLAAAIGHHDQAVVAIFVETSGAAEALLTSEIEPVAPWTPGPTARSWALAAEIGRDELVAAAGITPLPAIAIVKIGVDDHQREIHVDLETVGVLGVDRADSDRADSDRADTDSADSVVRGIAAALAVSPFAEAATLVGIGLERGDFVGHPHARILETAEQVDLLDRSDNGSVPECDLAPAFARRARATGGERWKPTIVFVSSRSGRSVDALAPRLGQASVVVGRPPEAGLMITPSPETDSGWAIHGRLLDRPPVSLIPIGLDRSEPPSSPPRLEVVADRPPGPVFMIRLFGVVDVVDSEGRSVLFEKSKARELLVWMVTHRHRSTRSAARTALWEVDVKNSTFSNVVSDARCSLARHRPPPEPDEWVGRRQSEELALADGIESDAEIIERALATARHVTPEAAVALLRPAVALIRGMPFESSGYLWPDGEGITSSLVVLGTSAATELAEHALGLGDLETVIWSTDHGLRILSGHEGLIGLRLRAHAMVGDNRALRHEWMSYLAAIAADPWSTGLPATHLALLFDELTSGARSTG